MKNSETKPARKRDYNFHVRLTKEEYWFITEMAKATVMSPVDFIRAVVLKGRSPKIKIHPWQADVYRELQLIRLHLEGLPQRMAPGEAVVIASQLDTLKELYLKTVQIMTHDGKTRKG